MLRISTDLKVGQEYYLVNDKEPLQGTFKLLEIQDEKLILIDKFDRKVEVLTDSEDDFKMFYNKQDFLDYEKFITSTLNKLRYLETFCANYSVGTSSTKKLLDILLQCTIN